ncbi:CNNM domain-containing protein [Desulfuromonas sp. TF]|uniref:CNNM domain-containing protein n=1 Tax=Desulfuromonas sp. TF TaxID=1232410 RepID=UPI000411C2F1|nr:hemolysin family protein [Desulfuromonas sp. TF]
MNLLLLYISLALVFSFLCSIAEAVLLSVTPAYIATLEGEGRRSGTLLRRFKENIDHPLAAILTLNTVAHTIGAAGAGAQAAAVFGSQWVGLASVVLTLLILFLSEIIPKTLGAVHWRSLAPVLADPLQWLIRILFPLVLLSEWLTRLISREKGAAVFERDELSAMADLGVESGELGQDESKMLKNLMQLRFLTLEDVMTPRTVIFALPETMSVAEVVNRHSDMAFSRLPLYGRGLDDITGFVLKNDVLLAHAQGEKDRPLKTMQREIAALSEGTRLPDALEILLNRRQHILLVQDPYGGTAGLATLEDILETLLGLEIVDEADRTVDMRALARESWRKRARTLGLVPEEDDPSARD